jgi:tyrosine-protein kinase Etk/Wzc
MANQTEQHQLNDIKKIDIIPLFYKHLNYWYIYLSVLAIGYTVGHYIAKYKHNVYSVSAQLIIKSEANSGMLIKNDIFATEKSINTEISSIKSYSTIQQTLKKLHHNITYKIEGEVQKYELHNNSPFKIFLDTNYNQLYNTSFIITPQTDTTFNIHTTGGTIRSYSDEAKALGFAPAYQRENILYNTAIEVPNICKFTVLRQTNIQFQKKNVVYSFSLQTLDQLTRYYLRYLNVYQPDEEASIIKLQLTGELPQKEIDFINELTKNYINRDLQLKNKIAENTVSFINQQLTLVAQQLDSTENKLQAFRNEHHIINIEQRSSSTFSKIEKLNEEKAQLMVKQKYIFYLLEYIKQKDNFDNIIAPSLIGINDPLLTSMIAELQELYAKKRTLEFSVSANNPALVIATKQFNGLYSSLIENIKQINQTNKLILEDLNNKIATTNKLLNQLPEQERELFQIERKHELNDEIYNFLLKNKAEIGIAKAGYSPENKILDCAKLDYLEPISPQRGKEKIKYALIALSIPLTIFSLIFFFDTRIKKINDLTTLLKVPFLGPITHYLGEAKIPYLDQTQSPLANTIRGIRIKLNYLISEKKHHAFAITSTIPGEGKTFCATNLAISFAHSQKKTILIGADLRKPKLHENFPAKKHVGLSEYLSDNYSLTEVIQTSEQEHLDIILSGAIPPNPTELLGSQKFNELITTLKKSYDIVLIDTPPTALVPDFYEIQKLVDLTIYVFRNNVSKKDFIDHVNSFDSNKVGVVLNAIKGKKNGYGYGYGYGYGEDLEKKEFIKKLLRKS